MPIARVQLPDGRIGRFEVPEGTTPEQVLSFAQKNLETQPESTPKPSIGETMVDQGLQGATFGFGDEAQAALAAPILSLINKRPISENYSAALKLAAEKLQEQAREHPGTSLTANIVGGLATGGVGAGTKTGTAITNSLRTGNLPARVAKSAAAAAASGGLYGAGTAGEGKRLEGAGEGAALGAAFGAAVPAVGATVSGVKNAILPKVNNSETAKLAKIAFKEGIPLSRSQIGDSRFAKGISSVTKSVPFSGSKEFAEKQITAFNKAVLSKAGIMATQATPEVLSNAADDFGKRFTALTQKTGVAVDDALLNEFAAIEAEATRRLGKDATRTVSSFIDDILDRGVKQGYIDGKTYQNTRSMLGKLSKSTSDSFLSSIYKSMQSSLDDAALNSLPQTGKKEWEAVRKQYSAFKTIQRAVTNSGEQAAIGNISPAQLAIAAKSGNSRYAMGSGELNELARVGAAFLKDAIPNSGTPERLAAYGAIFGAPGALIAGAPGAALSPVLGVGLSRAFNALDTAQPLVRGALKNAGKAIPRTSGVVPAILEGQAAKGITRETPAIAPSVPIETKIGPQSSADFDSAVDFVLNIEGGYVPDDAGKGPSNMGINKSANPDVDIRNLTTQKARSLYKKRYWNAVGADKLPPDLALVAFDASVNHGPQKAKALLRGAKGDPLRLIDLRRNEYIRLASKNPKKYGKYLKGWLDRLESLKTQIA